MDCAVNRRRCCLPRSPGDDNRADISLLHTADGHPSVRMALCRPQLARRVAARPCHALQIPRPSAPTFSFTTPALPAAGRGSTPIRGISPSTSRLRKSAGRRPRRRPSWHVWDWPLLRTLMKSLCGQPRKPSSPSSSLTGPPWPPWTPVRRLLIRCPAPWPHGPAAVASGPAGCLGRQSAPGPAALPAGLFGLLGAASAVGYAAVAADG
jgi:hypothetical protein